MQSSFPSSGRIWLARLAASLLWLASATQAFAQQTDPAAVLRFNFTSRPQTGAVSVTWDGRGGAPLYNAAAGFGFVNQTSALPARTVHTAEIRSDDDGAQISEPRFDGDAKSDHYNNYGMAFRVKAAPGAYAIEVRTTSDAVDTIVSVSGLQTSRLSPGVFWDAAGLLPNKTTVTSQGKQWSYRYVNGRGYIDIEIEPRKPNVPVGIAQIVIAPIPVQARPANALPTVYTLGDSTVKSYTFDEAPMSGWGQVIDRLFDLQRVRLVNYSMGGRSFRSAYAEGRLNDLLLDAHAGDAVLIQFGHNDESADEARRFGRGASEAMYESMLREVYLPAIRARGLVPVLVTPMSRVSGTVKPGESYVNSFQKRRFPDLMRTIGTAEGVTVVDLNARSVQYYNQAGVASISAMIMSIEAGETPGKTNDGSYANGHPANKIDGTHFKEALSKQYARMVASELARLGKAGDHAAAALAGDLRPAVKVAIDTNDWSAVFPEIARDIASGENAYYRNQIEKLLQLGALRTDANGDFEPQAIMQTRAFIGSLCIVMRMPCTGLAGYAESALRREVMGAILVDAYRLKFHAKPAFMTDYNGKSVVPGAPGYDPNLDSGARGAMYYPLVRWTELTDRGDTDPTYADKVREAYELGLIRSESGIARGQMVNGRTLEPKALVNRGKAAKALYFMWVLAQPPKAENNVVPASALSPVGARAEEPAGHWLGQMASGFKVRIDIVRTADGYAASLTNPSGVTTQLDRFVADGQNLEFGIRKLGLNYNGSWSEQEQRWQGTLHFQGQHPMNLRRANADELKPPVRKRPQEMAIQTGRLPYTAREVVFDNPAARLKLAGTLTFPPGAGPFPAVVLVSGTGPNTRDEDVGTHKWFLVLADALSRRGIAVLRYDKRGVGGSTGRYGGATTADFASDAKAAYDYMRTLGEIDSTKIGLLGHSEGGIIAPMVAASTPGVAFIALLASPAMRGDRLFAAQSATVSRLQGVPAEYIERRRVFDRALYEAVIAAPSEAEARFRASRIVQQGVADKIVDAADAEQLPASISAPWQRYFLAHDPALVLSKLRLPILVINGALDAQVPQENTVLFRDALRHNPQARIVELAGKNHLLQSAGTGAPTEYEDIDGTISPDALALIEAWVERACAAAIRAR